MSYTRIKLWYKHLKDGQESVESGSHSGSPLTSRIPKNIEHVWVAINENQQLAV